MNLRSSSASNKLGAITSTYRDLVRYDANQDLELRLASSHHQQRRPPPLVSITYLRLFPPYILFAHIQTASCWFERPPSPCRCSEHRRTNPAQLQCLSRACRSLTTSPAQLLGRSLP